MDSVRLLSWLLFRPSAWRARVRALDVGLSPHFCLAEVGRAFWADPAWRRLTAQWLLGRRQREAGHPGDGPDHHPHARREDEIVQ